MNEKQYQQNDTDDEELVAYLDGELSADQRREVESRIARDASYRARMGELQRSWAFLDVLPQAVVDHSLTQSTMEMVAADLASGAAASDVHPHADISKSGGRSTKWLSLAAAAALGFCAIALPIQWRRHRALQDIPIAMNLELYRFADDTEFLEALVAEHVFAEDFHGLPE